ncbi:MAG TPA: GNAT family protein [Candidatus Limnocylindrales bacterium]|nr:GNAT family protein [Candidatus Limnocylindrales bacterium]
MAKPLPRPDPPLADEAVRLRPIEPSDAADIHAACQDPLIAHFIPIPQPYRMTDAEAFAGATSRAWDEGVAANFAILDRADGRFLGVVTLHVGWPRRAMVGYWLAPWGRGRGIMTRAVRLLAAWSIPTFDLVRLSLYTLDDNLSSQRVAERAGFTREGVLRAYADRLGQPRDCVMFSLLPADLAAERRADLPEEPVK